MSKTFTAADVAAHKSPSDLYIIVDGDVYDLTKFQEDHPGSFSPSLSPIPLSALSLREGPFFAAAKASWRSRAPHT